MRRRRCCHWSFFFLLAMISSHFPHCSPFLTTKNPDHPSHFSEETPPLHCYDELKQDIGTDPSIASHLFTAYLSCPFLPPDPSLPSSSRHRLLVSHSLLSSSTTAPQLHHPPLLNNLVIPEDLESKLDHIHGWGNGFRSRNVIPLIRLLPAGKSFTLSWLSEKHLFPLEQFLVLDFDVFREFLPEANLSRNISHSIQREVGYLVEVHVGHESFGDSNPSDSSSHTGH